MPLLAVLVLMGCFIFMSGELTELCLAGLKLCAGTIIPSLFPFFVLCSTLNSMGLPGVIGNHLARPAAKIYGISGAGASAIIIGLTGGYPLGAAYIADMEKSGAISASEGERLIGFCNNSGPAFIVGAVGCGVFHSAKTGLILYAVHIISALITGLFMRNKSSFSEIQPVQLDSTDPALCFTNAVKSSVASILNICGFIVFFTLLLGLCESSGLTESITNFLYRYCHINKLISRAFLFGFTELGSGIGVLQGLRLCPQSLSLTAFILGFGSISVYIQTKAVLSGSKIKGTLHFAGHLMCASIGAVLAYIIGLFL